MALEYTKQVLMFFRGGLNFLEGSNSFFRGGLNLFRGVLNFVEYTKVIFFFNLY